MIDAVPLRQRQACRRPPDRVPVRTLLAVVLAVMLGAGCTHSGGGTVPAERPSNAPTAGPVPSGSAPATFASDDPPSSDCGGKAASIRLTGQARSIRTAVRVCTPPSTGTAYWLVAQSAADSLYYPKYPISGARGRSERVIVLGAGVVHGSSRTFTVVQVPAAGVAWMQDAAAHDASNDAWQGDRTKLPDGTQTVSNAVPYVLA